MTDGALQRLGFLGVRIADSVRFHAAVSLYRDTLGLTPFREKPDQLVWFRLGDGTELHIYGPKDTDHTAFGERPCVGFNVEDVGAARASMEAKGIAFLWDTQHDEAREWAHYRGPDGAVYELIGPLCSRAE